MVCTCSDSRFRQATKCRRTFIQMMKTSQLYPGRLTSGWEAHSMKKNGQALKVGGFVHMPKGMQHFAWPTGETIIQLHGMGPQAITYVNPADDPRKSN